MDMADASSAYRSIPQAEADSTRQRSRVTVS